MNESKQSLEEKKQALLLRVNSLSVKDFNDIMDVINGIKKEYVDLKYSTLIDKDTVLIDCDISVRTLNLLRSINVNTHHDTLFDLSLIKLTDLKDKNGMGKKTINEIVHLLKTVGLKLKTA